MKTVGMDEFSKRIDDIFAMGNPTKAQIIDAYNKAATEREAKLQSENKKLREFADAMKELNTRLDRVMINGGLTPLNMASELREQITALEKELGLNKE